ncbi:MAG: hypothetical protein ACPHY8_05975 [Patescibacteria group bacterium]
MNNFCLFSNASPPSTCNSHFSENRIAIGFVASILANIMLIITIIGTESNIPEIHQIFPQKVKAIMINKGERLSLFPINLGSTIFPMSTCIPTIQIMIVKNGREKPNCTKEIVTGKIVAIIDPILGIKLSKNITIVQKNAKSNQTAVIKI